jgi:hypothetical protein
MGKGYMELKKERHATSVNGNWKLIVNKYKYVR